MSSKQSLILWAVIFAISYYVFRYKRIRNLSAVAISSFIALLVSFMFYVPTTPTDIFESDGMNALYAFVASITYIFLIFYLLLKATSDVESPMSH